MRMMIDIETLGLVPNTVVLSCAAIALEEDHRVKSALNLTISIEEQLELGRIIDGGTLQWWCGEQRVKNPGAFEAAFAPRDRNIRTAEYLLDGLEEQARPCEEVWSKGPAFDQVILDSLAKDLGRRPFCSYREVRDVRTAQMALRRLGLEKLETYLQEEQARILASYIVKEAAGQDMLEEHHPLWDCAEQLAWVVVFNKALNEFKIGLEGT